MLNQDKFKTAEERVGAFFEGWRNYKSSVATVIAMDFAKWLALEAEEKPENCPFCGVHSRICNTIGELFFVECSNGKCGYRSANETTKESAIYAHNRVARAVRAAEKGEVK